jgi:NADH dehydrogenase
MQISRIVIAGAGVAGIRVAKKVSARIREPDIKVTLIDQNDYHQYLYRIPGVCNTMYKEKDIIVPIRRLVDEKKITFKRASIKTVDINRKVVVTDKGEEPYDVLVLALGSHPAYFNIPGIRENSLTFGSYMEAKTVRKRIRVLAEEAAKTMKMPRIIIGGAGFTGVELAGELTDSLLVLYKELKVPQSEKLVNIVEALDDSAWMELGTHEEGTEIP